VCGIAGVFTIPGDGERLADRAGRMAGRLAHRGPDDRGVWAEPSAGVGFAFRRLAIIDLSCEGHQPMRSPSGRFTLVFNGEVYNHQALRRLLAADGFTFRGHSDTEVILAAFERWEIEHALPRFVGMFAMAVWDAQRRELVLVRDRLGIKPLFVAPVPGAVLFGSELKALAADPAFDRTVDRDAATAYLRHLYVPGDRTIYRGAVKVPPGHRLVITDPRRPLPPPLPYWSLPDVARAGSESPFRGSDAEAVDALEERLTEAVALRMIADVPVGALLSGGIDSSTVVALMQKTASRPVRTFTIGFDAREYDEAAHAARVAAYLGTDHTSLHVTGEDALAVVPRLAEIFDEPFADPSQLPTLLVCELARREVTVALTGDGGDELFAGYNRYVFGQTVVPHAARLPVPVRRLMSRALLGLPPRTWDRIWERGGVMLPAWARPRLAGEKLAKLGQVLAADTPPRMYESLLSAWHDPAGLVDGGGDADGSPVLAAFSDDASGRSLLGRMLLADQATYLPDDLLAKVDRVSMAVSLEARVPLLDHRVVEFSWTLPASLKVRDGRGKWLLREVLHRHVPRALVERPKMGFSVPVARWLRGPLRPWAEDLLSPAAVRSGGTLRPGAVRREWSAFLAGRDDKALGMWAVLMLRAWEDRWLLGGVAGPAPAPEYALT
jgi:asparagine synthase (glutamine-hydrolysing)